MQVLLTEDPRQKAALTHHAWQKFKAGELSVGQSEPPAQPARPAKPQVQHNFLRISLLLLHDCDHFPARLSAVVMWRNKRPYFAALNVLLYPTQMHVRITGSVLCSWFLPSRCQLQSSHRCPFQYTCECRLSSLGWPQCIPVCCCAQTAYASHLRLVIYGM